MVEALDKNTQKSIATKALKKPQSNAFATFLKDLGKTIQTPSTSLKQADLKTLSNIPNQSTNTKENTNAKAHAKANGAEFLSQFFANKNETFPQATQKPLDAILQKAPQKLDTKKFDTQKLNTQNPATQKNATQNPIMKLTQNGEFSSKDIKNISSDSTSQDSAFDSLTTQDMATKDSKNIIDLKDLPKNSNDISKNTPKNHADSSNLLNLPQKDSANLTQKVDSSKVSKNATKQSQISQDSKSQDSDTKDIYAKDSPQIFTNSTKDLAQSLIPKNPAKSNANASLEQNLSSLLTPNNSPKISDDISKNTPKNPADSSNSPNTPQDSSQNFANIGIKNTLKYGAFAAFDALSLLKPSDGKKLSELIKKADELSLNLQSIKYTRIAQNKPILNNTPQPMQNLKPPLDSTNLAQEALQNQTQDTKLTNEAQKAQPKDSIINNAPKIDKNDAKNNDKANFIAESKPEPKAESKLDLKEIPKNDLTPKQNEPKIDSKMAESPLKNILESKENSDIKPANFKAENKTLEPKKPESPHSPLFTAESATKIEHKIFDAKETMRHFASHLKQEIQNYKPPLSKITIELQPANLGGIEVSIISQGKNIQIQLQSNQQTINLFIQNQSDLRNALAQIGYENVAMSFSNGSQMGFSDNSGKWRYESNAKFRNAFSLNNESEESDDIFEIMITNNYA